MIPKMTIPQLIKELERVLSHYKALLDTAEVRGFDASYFESEIEKCTTLIAWLEELANYRKTEGKTGVEPGRWLVGGEMVDYRGVPGPVWICSECGKKYGTDAFNYCPNCGHTMRTA